MPSALIMRPGVSFMLYGYDLRHTASAMLWKIMWILRSHANLIHRRRDLRVGSVMVSPDGVFTLYDRPEPPSHLTALRQFAADQQVSFLRMPIPAKGGGGWRGGGGNDYHIRKKTSQVTRTARSLT